MATLVVILIITLLGAFLLARGVRGRLIGDRAYCLRCGYDITARSIDSSNCAECGADLSRPRTIRIGQRQRRRGSLLGGCALLALTLPIIATFAIVKVRHIDLIRYRPTSWLIKDALTSATKSDRDAAIDELFRRATGNLLGASQSAALANAALAEQANRAKPWNGWWGAIIETLHASHHLSDDDWHRYAVQSIGIVLRVRPHIVRGDPIPLALRLDARVCGHYSLACECKPLVINCNSIQLMTGAVMSGETERSTFSAGGGFGSSGIDPSLLRNLPSGMVTIRGVFDCWVNDARVFRGEPWAGKGEANSISQQTVSATFELVDDDHAHPISFVEPAPREQMRQSVQVEAVSFVKGRIEGQLLIAPAIVPLAAKVVARFPDGREFDCGRVIAGRVTARTLPIHSISPIVFSTTQPAPTSIDLILRPDIDFAREQIDETPIWGEPIVIEHLLVTQR